MPHHRTTAISVLRAHVNSSRAVGLDSCGSEHGCSAALEDLLAEQRAQDDALAYDIAVVAQKYTSSVPDLSWPTAALARVTRDRLLAPPWHDSFKRNMVITCGLARLGERGLPPDAVVRTCMADAYRRQMVMQLATMWHSMRTDDINVENLPHQVQPWIPIIDGDPAVIALGDHPALMDVVAACLTGKVSSVADAWIQEASITHIIDWRISDPLRVVISAEDATVPAGPEASQWLLERFSVTSLRDWRKSSLEWEIAWHHDAERVAHDVGVALERLRERPTDISSVVSALSYRLRETAESDEVAQGLTAMEVVEQIVGMVQEGERVQAGALARGARDRVPGDRRIRGALAFCAVPDNPAEARKMVLGLLPPTGPERSLHEANLISTYLAEGDSTEAQILLGRLGATCGEAEAWLWIPRTLTPRAGVPALRGYKIKDWVLEAQAVAAQP